MSQMVELWNFLFVRYKIKSNSNLKMFIGDKLLGIEMQCHT